jgi:Uma2 family endonuclease
MRRPAGRHYTVEDYFAIEENSAVKHEYFDGEIFAMAGASLAHNRIASNLHSALSAKLGSSGCEVFGSDLRVRTPSGLLTYPDVMVICGNVELSAEDRLDTVVNPAMIIEVLSDSTRDYDRGEKSERYREAPSLCDYMMVDQGAVRVEILSAEYSTGATPRNWTSRLYARLDQSIRIESIGLDLRVGEIYARVGLAVDDSR